MTASSVEMDVFRHQTTCFLDAVCADGFTTALLRASLMCKTVDGIWLENTEQSHCLLSLTTDCGVSWLAIIGDMCVLSSLQLRPSGLLTV